MLMMTGMIALTALTIMFLIVPIASKMEDVVHGSAVVLLVIEAMILMNKQLAKIDADKLKQSVWNLITLTLMFATISLVAAFILPMISENMKNVVIGGVVVLAVIGIMIGMTWLLSKIDAENLEQANKTLLVLTVMLVAVSVVAAFLLPAIGQNWQDVAVGAVVVLAIIGLMVGMVALVNLIKKESLEQTYMTLGVLTVMLVAVSLVANFLLPEIGKNWKEVALGGVVVMGIIALMVGMAWLTSLIGQDTLKETYITLGVLTLMLVAVSLVTKFILIPIGEEWKEAALGGVVVMGIMALMVGMTWVLSTIDEDKMKQAWISLAVMTVCLLVVSLIVSELLIPIGYEWDAAAIGGAVVLGVIAIMTAIVAAAAQIKREKVINGAITMAVVAGMLWAVSTIIEENFIPIGDEWEAAALGGAVILGTIGIMTAIIAAAGQMDLKTIGKGALAIAAVTGLLWLIGKAFEPYIQTSLLMYENAKEVAIGGAEIIATIIVFGLIMTGIGALMTFGAAFMAMGAAAIAGITGIIYLIAEAFPPYIELTKLANENKSAIRNGSGVVVDIIEQFGLLMGKIGAMMLLPFVGVALAAGAAAIAGITATIALIGDSLDPFVAVMIKIRDNNINQQSIKQFMQVFIGNGIKDKETPSLYNSIVQIVEALNEVGVWSATMAGVIAKNLRPIFETLGMFIDVIGRICSMKYVSEWNTDGTPAAYETISMPMFREAGNTISTTFGTFLTELGRGLDAIKDVSYVTIMKLASGIGPIMSSVKNFTDAILSVISSKIPEEYDEEGKVIKWRSFNNEEFGNAAVVISDAFMTFLEEFGERSKNVSARSAIVISLMKEGIEPVMNAVATYTQTIMDFVVGKEVEYTDVKTGKNVKKIFEISPQKFKEYGTTIAETFIGFIESMWKAFNEQGYTEHHYENMNDGGWFSSDTIVDNAVSKNHITDLIAGMSGISQIMQAVQTFIDVIFKTAEAAGKVNLESEGQKISRTFTGFINALVDAFLENETTNIAGFKFEDTIVSKKMTATIDGLNKSNKMIKTFDNVYKNLSKVVQKYAGTITDD